ncbi:hypothetical protein AVBRAN12640_03640 [Campylobacter sp. RM12640]|uniref:hypothetical protein n=1 Tax=unclassified Campylobacter TaxID=2593542 RepID=UPI003014DB90|nr:hypothetical protein [Campylobacter sp. RM12640]MBZ7988505.1 hypothetical protein [Campylobacter sp. RM12635]
MAFKNAIIDDRLEKKYSFVDICIEHTNDWYLRQHHKFPFEERIVIDEELDCWFMNCMYFDDPELDHAKLNKSLWILYYKGEHIRIILDYDISQEIDNVVYDKVYKILSIRDNKTLNEKEIIALLREILVVYKWDGSLDEKEECTIYVREEVLKDEV